MCIYKKRKRVVMHNFLRILGCLWLKIESFLLSIFFFSIQSMHHNAKKGIIVSILFLSFSSTVFAIIVGSNTAVSVNGFVAFPSNDSTNEIRGFVTMNNGFSLPNATTMVLYNALFPIYGNITLNNGLVNLAKDLTLASNVTLTNSSNINGNTLSLNLPDQIATFTTTGTVTFGNVSLFARSNVTLGGRMTFTNTCAVEGNNYIIDCSNGSISVGAGASVFIKDALIRGVSTNTFFCVDNTGTFSLENVTLALNGVFTFTLGSFEIFSNVTFTGANRFVYQSSKTSKIHSNSMWYFDSGMTFSYTSAVNNALSFDDNTAYLHLYETTLYASAVGLALTKGSVVIDGTCPIFNDGATSAGGISIGDGASTVNDISLFVLAESGLNIRSGFFVDKNV